MSYYILPKYTNKENINISIKLTEESNIDILVTPSLLFYLNNILLQLNNPIFLSNFNKINKLINPYKYLYTNIQTYNLSISKLNLSISSYIYIELIYLCNLLDSFNISSINCIHINTFDIIDSINTIRLNNDDIHYNFSDLTTNLTTRNNADIINIDLSNNFTDFNSYILLLINSLIYILTNQKNNGISIIKIDYLFYKPIIDILYILNVVYEKVYIVKPNVSNLIKNEIYIVCKHFELLPNIEIYIAKLQTILSSKISSTSIIYSLIDDDIPYYLLNKIEEANIIIYHQKIQYMDQINNIIINNHKTKNIKKHNIQKCIQWCEKYKIPHNKITDKVNIFLHPILEDIQEEINIEPIEVTILINLDPIDISTISKQLTLLNIFNIED